MKTGVLLINLGTPKSPSTKDVRKYLSEFLNDPRVIDIPFIARLLLVNLIIVPFRSPKSAKLYKQIWNNGFPLLVHGKALKEKLQAKIGANYVVELAMRYQEPNMKDALLKLKKNNIHQLILIPLYPQYASSSTGSSLQKAMNIINTWEVIPSIKTIGSFYDKPFFIDAWEAIAQQYDVAKYDHILFSFHGLPERQIKKADATATCLANKNCCDSINENNSLCYKASCFQTARSIAERIGISQEKYTVAFQSRLGKTPWIKPYADEIIIEKAKAGIKNMLVFSASFVADCLETTYEIGVEYDHLFKQHGGEKLQLVESLNTHPLWIKALETMIK